MKQGPAGPHPVVAEPHKVRGMVISYVYHTINPLDSHSNYDVAMTCFLALAPSTFRPTASKNPPNAEENANSQEVNFLNP